MDLTGYAYLGEKEIKERENRKERLKFLLKYKPIEIETINRYRNSTIYTGKIIRADLTLTEFDIAMLCDGLIPFGGTCKKFGNRFTCTVYTD